MKTIVVGLGNPILGDDGVGWRVAEAVMSQLESPSSQLPLPAREANRVDVECLALGGISLMEHLIGYERAILIDACFTDEEPGSLIVLNLKDMPDLSAFHTTSAHDMSLQNALKLGRKLGVLLPDYMIVVGISARQIRDFSEELSPPIANAVPTATRIVMELVMQESQFMGEESHPPG